MRRRGSRASRLVWRPARAMAAAGIVLLLAVPGSPVGAQEEGLVVDESEETASALGGFQLLASAVGMEATFDQPGALPATPTAQGSVPYSTTSLSTGPTAAALASVAWPGVLFGNGGTAAQQSGAPEESHPYFEHFNYKVRSEAFSPQGPEQHENSGYPGVTMRTEAHPDAAESTGRAHGTDPGYVGTGTYTSHARSALDTGKGLSEGVATASDISLAAGAVTIDSVVSVARATTDGVTATVEGQTTVNGLVIGGQPATIDGDGVRAGEEGGGAGPLTASASQIVNQTLALAHMKMYLLEPDDTVDGANGERVLGGLVVEWENTATDPPQTVVLTYAGVMVSVAASQGTDAFLEEDFDETFEEPLDEEPVVESLDLSGEPDGDGSFATPSFPDSGDSGGTAATGTVANASPISYAGGLPAGLLVLALAAGAGLAAGFRRLADDVLAVGAGTTCFEERP